MSSNILTERDTNPTVVDTKVEKESFSTATTGSTWTEKSTNNELAENINTRYCLLQIRKTRLAPDTGSQPSQNQHLHLAIRQHPLARQPETRRIALQTAVQRVRPRSWKQRTETAAALARPAPARKHSQLNSRHRSKPKPRSLFASAATRHAHNVSNGAGLEFAPLKNVDGSERPS